MSDDGEDGSVDNTELVGEIDVIESSENKPGQRVHKHRYVSPTSLGTSFNIWFYLAEY